MDFEITFKLYNLSVLPGWLLLLVAPRNKATQWLVYSYAYPIFLGLSYIALLIIGLQDSGGGMGSLAELRVSFESDAIILLAWLHYLVFDLFIGSWEVRDAERIGLSHGWAVPCILLTLFLGPVGLLLYLLIRGFKAGVWTRNV